MHLHENDRADCSEVIATPFDDASDCGGGGEGEGEGGDCPTTNLTVTDYIDPACFSCLQSSCCAELESCDADETCVLCIEDPIENQSVCVDGKTFAFNPTAEALNGCQFDVCTTPCSGGVECVPGVCTEGCLDFPECLDN